MWQSKGGESSEDPTKIEPLLKQVKLRVKSLKKADELTQENFNSSIGRQSDKQIDGAKSSVSSVGDVASTSTNGQKRLKLKFKARNFNQKSHRDDTKHDTVDGKDQPQQEILSPNSKQ